ncbi:MAG: hypothetical protein GY952_05495 [Rhodobacteraceae bacterium]|nr:hypothetical protein [Paracoccaceae bacterium]
MGETRGFSLKDHLFNADTVAYLAGLFAARDARFPEAAVVDQVMARLPELELKQRIVMIAEVLEQFLPQEFAQTAAVIETALPPPLDPTKTDDDFGRFIFAPLGEIVARNGLAQADLAMSFHLLRELTTRFSVEFPIRQFLNRWPDETLAQMAVWVKDEHYHVRRLVSEGTRPSLPWGVKVGLALDAGLPFLDQLHRDPTRFVTRSVANHLNDIAKVEPELVVVTLRRWQEAGEQEAAELDWMTRHALRTLVKRGDKAALELLGFRDKPDIELGPFHLDPPDGRVAIGDGLGFEVEIVAQADERLLVDFVIDFVKARGERKPKVFKLKQVDMKAGDRLVLSKKHRFPGNATTFKLYPGTHRLSVQVNGQIMAHRDFELHAG